MMVYRWEEMLQTPQEWFVNLTTWNFSRTGCVKPQIHCWYENWRGSQGDRCGYFILFNFLVAKQSRSTSTRSKQQDNGCHTSAIFSPLENRNYCCATCMSQGEVGKDEPGHWDFFPLWNMSDVLKWDFILRWTRALCVSQHPGFPRAEVGCGEHFRWMETMLQIQARYFPDLSV